MRQLNHPSACLESWILLDQLLLLAPGSDVGDKAVGFHDILFTHICCTRHRFWGVSCAGSMIRAFSKEPRATLSCRLAPVTTSDKGDAILVYEKISLCPIFSPIRRIRPDGLSCRDMGQFFIRDSQSQDLPPSPANRRLNLLVRNAMKKPTIAATVAVRL